MKCWHRICRGGVALFIMALCLACNLGGQRGNNDEAQPFKPIVRLGEGSKLAVRDYQANVKVYYSHNRIAGSERLHQEYRLSTKIIDGAIYTRLDYYNNPQLGTSERSVITGPEETVVFKPSSGEVEMRMPSTSTDYAAAARIAPDLSLFAKLDLPKISAQFRSLGYDVQDELSQSGFMVASMPQELLARSSLAAGKRSRPFSFKLFFDAASGAMAGTESIEVEDDGTRIVSTDTKIYQEVDGIQVPVGSVNMVEHDMPYTLDVSDSALGVLNDPAGCPQPSQEELDSLIAEGSAMEVPMVTLGDPSDPDYRESYVTVYESVQTNCLSDAFFRVQAGR